MQTETNRVLTVLRKNKKGLTTAEVARKINHTWSGADWQLKKLVAAKLVIRDKKTLVYTAK